jgi:hypothetical protein
MSLGLLLIGALNAQEVSFCEPRLLDLGGYYLEVDECLSLSNGGSITYSDSVEKDTVAYVNMFLNGGVVNYDDFLGVTNLDVNVPVFGSDQPVDYLGARKLIQEFYDTGRFSPNKLTKKEMEKGNELFEKLLLDALDGRSSAEYDVSLISFEKLEERMDSYLERMEDYCPECRVDVPIKRRLRAVVEYMVENKVAIDEKYVWDFNFGGNGLRMEVSEDLDLVVIRSDQGKAYWDGGEFGHLDGQVDMVTAGYSFLRSEFDSSLGLHVVETDLFVHQDLFDSIFVDLLHDFLPESDRVYFDDYVFEEKAKMP